MWFIQPKQDFISQMSWKYTGQATAMAWQVKARDHDISRTYWELVFFALMGIGIGGVMSLMFDSWLHSLLMVLGVLIPLMFAGMCITHSTTIFVYRVTETMLERHSWKPHEAAGSAFLKWAAIILLPVVGVLALLEPPLIIASIGPLGMGLMALQTGSQQAKNDSMKSLAYDWRKTDKIYLYPGRDIIGLNIPWYSPTQNRIVPNGVNSIHCKESDRDDVLRFFTSRLPNVEVVEEKYFL